MHARHCLPWNMLPCTITAHWKSCTYWSDSTRGVCSMAYQEFIEFVNKDSNPAIWDSLIGDSTIDWPSAYALLPMAASVWWCLWNGSLYPNFCFKNALYNISLVLLFCHQRHRLVSWVSIGLKLCGRFFDGTVILSSKLTIFFQWLECW